MRALQAEHVTVQRVIISKNRHDFISTNFCMDDSTTRLDRWMTERFKACREFFDLFNVACSLAVRAGDFVTIDKTLHENKV